MIGKGIVLNRAELICLLDQMEADRLLGGEPDLLPHPAKDDLRAMIQKGYLILRQCWNI